MVRNSYISGIGFNLPDKIMKNDELSNYMDTSDEWITERSGIKERRVVDRHESDGVGPSDLAIPAAEQALKIHQSLTVRPHLINEQKVDIHKALAKDYIEIGYTDNAREEAKKILSIEKRNLWSIKFLIQTAEENQDWEEAAKWSKHLQKVTGKKEINDVARFDIYKGLDFMKNGNNISCLR